MRKYRGLKKLHLREILTANIYGLYYLTEFEDVIVEFAYDLIFLRRRGLPNLMLECMNKLANLLIHSFLCVE